jgi:O-antigen ligase
MLKTLTTQLKLPNNWINLLVFFFSFSVLALPRHGGESAIILLLIGLYLFFKKDDLKTQYKFNKDELILLILILMFCFLNVFGAFFQPEFLGFNSYKRSLRAIDNPMRWLLMIPILFIFKRYIINWKFVAIGLSLGVVFSVSIAIYQVHFLNIDRAFGAANHPISFGEIMVVTDLLLWIFMLIAWNKNHKLLSLILFIASLIAFYGSLLSQTRGAWLAYVLLIISFVFFIVRQKSNSKKKMFSKTLLLRLLLTLVVLFLTIQTNQYQEIQQRSLNTASQAIKGNLNAASGGRLSIYNTSIQMFQSYPFGVGTDNFRQGGKLMIMMNTDEIKGEYIKNQKGTIIKPYKSNFNLSEEIRDKNLRYKLNMHLFIENFHADGGVKLTSRYRHAHNEWLNVLAENGIQGIIIFTLIFLISIKIFLNNLRDKNSLISAYSTCGLLLTSSYIIFGQTQSIFTNHQVLIFFIFFLYFFIGQISRLKVNNSI